MNVNLCQEWGHVCAKSWSSAEADVVCRQLGYQESLSAVSASAMGLETANDQPTLLDLTCAGSERRIEACLPKLTGLGRCSRESAAAVRCAGEGFPLGLLTRLHIPLGCSEKVISGLQSYLV